MRRERYRDPLGNARHYALAINFPATVQARVVLHGSLTTPRQLRPKPVNYRLSPRAMERSRIGAGLDDELVFGRGERI